MEVNEETKKIWNNLFTNELPGHLRTPLALAYKYKR